MSESLDLLRPGGVMFLQTPRWSFMDTVGLSLHWISRGRWTRLTDRRVAPHHMVLHSTTSIQRLLEGVGFEAVAAKPRVRFSLQIHDYLESLGVSPRLARILARPFTALIDNNLFPRNVLDVFALRPASFGRLHPADDQPSSSSHRSGRCIGGDRRRWHVGGGGSERAPCAHPDVCGERDRTRAARPFRSSRPELAPDDQPTIGGQTSGPAGGASDTSSPTPGETPGQSGEPDGSTSATEAPDPDRDEESDSKQPTVPAPKPSGVKVPDVKVPGVEVPDVGVPDVDVPDVSVPELPGLNSVEVPEVEVPEVEVPEVEAPAVKAPALKVPTVALP